MRNSSWESLKEGYKKIHPGTDDTILDKIAVLDILKGCSNGISSGVIATTLGYEVSYVQEAITKYLGLYQGWGQSLEFSPLQVFLKYPVLEDYARYVVIILLQYPILTEGAIGVSKQSYDVAKKYCEIEKEIEEYYANN